MKNIYSKAPSISERHSSPWQVIDDPINPWILSYRKAFPITQGSSAPFSVFSFSSIATLVAVNLILVALIVQTRTLRRIEAGGEPVPAWPASSRLEVAAVSSGSLEERFQKISTVLSYLLNQRTPSVSPDALAESDLPVATIVVDKAYLRSGPGKEHSPVMALSRGTRLVVERQEGNWYEVTGPTGNRLWVAGEVLEVQNS